MDVFCVMKELAEDFFSHGISVDYKIVALQRVTESALEEGDQVEQVEFTAAVEDLGQRDHGLIGLEE